MSQDPAAGWIGQGGKSAIQSSGRMFNHLVNYYPKNNLCKLKIQNNYDTPSLCTGPVFVARRASRGLCRQYSAKASSR
jgi:hypothetical protein